MCIFQMCGTYMEVFRIYIGQKETHLFMEQNRK